MKFVIVAIAFSASCVISIGQSGFNNLGFEDANIDPSTPDFSVVSRSRALPGWSVTIGTVPQTTVLYNGSTGGASYLGLDSRVLIEGRFTVFFLAGGGGDVAISQAGVISPDVQSIRFKTSVPGPGGAPALFISGEDVQYTLLDVTPQYAQFGADIARFAGRAVDLTFSTVQPPGGASGFGLDSIQFSTQAIPEPSTAALGLTGLGLLAWVSCRRTGN